MDSVYVVTGQITLNFCLLQFCSLPVTTVTLCGTLKIQLSGGIAVSQRENESPIRAHYENVLGP